MYSDIKQQSSTMKDCNYFCTNLITGIWFALQKYPHHERQNEELLCIGGDHGNTTTKYNVAIITTGKWGASEKEKPDRESMHPV